MNKKIKILLIILIVVSMSSGLGYFLFRMIYVNFYADKINYNHDVDPPPTPQPDPTPSPKPNPINDKINLENIILIKDIGYQDDLTETNLIKGVQEKNINLNINWVKLYSLQDSSFILLPTTEGNYYSNNKIKISFVNGTKVSDFGVADTNIEFTISEKSQILKRVDQEWIMDSDEFQFVFFERFLKLLPTKSKQSLQFAFDDDYKARVASATYQGKSKKFIWTYKL